MGYFSNIEDPSVPKQVITANRPYRRGFNIEEFRTELTTGGMLRSNHGHLLFNNPAVIPDSLSDNRPILLRIEEMSIPSVWFTTDDNIRRYGYGPIENVPVHPQFDTYSISVIADKNGFVHEYFSTWMNGIVNFDMSEGIIGTKETKPYETAYRQDYVVDMVIKVYDVTTEEILEYRMMDAFPRAMNESRVAWAERDNIIKLQVQFEYRDWRLLNKGRNLSFNSVFDSVLTTFENVRRIG